MTRAPTQHCLIRCIQVQVRFWPNADILRAPAMDWRQIYGSIPGRGSVRTQLVIQAAVTAPAHGFFKRDIVRDRNSFVRYDILLTVEQQGE